MARAEEAAGVLYKPSRWGEIYHAAPYDELLGAGAAGVGKSVVLLMEVVPYILLEHERCERAIDHPHPLKWGYSKARALHLRRTYKELGETIARSQRFFPELDPGARFVRDDPEFGMGWKFSSGFTLQYGHCHDPDDWMSFQGFEYVHISFDELVTFLEEQYDGISTRLRSDDPIYGKESNHLLKIRSMSNPVVIRTATDSYAIRNPHWVRDRFVEPAPKGNVVLARTIKRADGTSRRVTWMYLPARLSDNPNKEFVAQYEVQLAKQKPYIRKALLDGDWFATPGAYFGDEWDPHLHICKAFKIPIHWKRFRAMDWGYKMRGTIGWFAMDEEENLFLERELSFQGMRVSEVAREVKVIEKDLGVWRGQRSRLTGPADTQLWEERGDDGATKADQFAKHGIFWVPAQKARQTNAERIADRLKDHDGGTTTPGLVIFERCRMMIKAIPTIQADPKNPAVPLDGGDDHDIDMLGYACSYASRGKAGIAYRTDDEDDEDEPREHEFERGGYGYG